MCGDHKLAACADDNPCACELHADARPFPAPCSCGGQQSEYDDGARGDAQDSIMRNPAFERPLCDLVEFCAKERSTEEISTFMRTVPWPKTFVMAPDAFVSMLEGQGCLSLHIFVDGAPYEGHANDLCDDESIDEDAVVSYAYKATETGRSVAKRLRERSSVPETVESDKGLRAAFLRVLELCLDEGGCTSKRINEVLRSESLLPLDASGNPRIFSTYFTDALERCRALTWQSSWKTTDEGRDYLEQAHAGN